MVEVRQVPKSDIEAVYRMRTDRVGDLPLETVREWHEEMPELFVGAYDGGELVGICIGREGPGEGVLLDAIAVSPSHVRRGIGSALLDAFEERAASLGYDRVGLGSAGGYVDEFYIANGYEPASVLVRLQSEDVPADYREMGYEIIDERNDDGTRKLYVGVDGYDPEFVEDVRDAFDDPDAIYIMEKRLGSCS